jgi:hypothetical protein
VPVGEECCLELGKLVVVVSFLNPSCPLSSECIADGRLLGSYRHVVIDINVLPWLCQELSKDDLEWLELPLKSRNYLREEEQRRKEV